MQNEQCGTQGQMRQENLYYKCLSWSAVFAGALIGVGLNFLLNLFSITLGLSAVVANKEGTVSLAIGGFLALLISAIASFFVAGTAAGYLGRGHCPKRHLGVLYGFTSWCLALLLSVLLASSMGHYVTNYTSFITNPTPVALTHTVNMPVLSSSVNDNTAVLTVNAEKAAYNLSMTTFLLFVLFFAAALASCFGGHYGMACDEIFCKRDCYIRDVKP